MLRKRPSPSPGPGWVALAEGPSSNSSGEDSEDEIAFDNNESSYQRTTTSQPLLKRKESDHLESLSKRPKHDQRQRPSGNLGTTSASTATRPKSVNQSSASGSAAGSSRLSNATAVSAGPRPLSSMLPPPLPTKSIATASKSQYPSSQPTVRSHDTLKSFGATRSVSSSQSSVQANAEASSSTSSFKKKEFPSSLDRKLFDRARQSPTKVGSSLGRSVSAREIAMGKAHTIRPRSNTNDFITDSRRLSAKGASAVVDMSDEDDPPPKKFTARKSVSGKMATKPPISNDPIEVIEISSDTDEEPRKPQLSIQSTKPQSFSPRPTSQKSTPISSLTQKKVSASRRASENDKMNVNVASLSKALKPQSSGPNTNSLDKKPLNQATPQTDVGHEQPPSSRQSANTNTGKLVSSPMVKPHASDTTRRSSSNISASQTPRSITNPFEKTIPTAQDSSPEPSTSIARPKSLNAFQQLLSTDKKHEQGSSSKSITKPVSVGQKASLETSGKIANEPAKFDRPQVAVKSVGGIKPKERKKSWSESSSDSRSNSDGDTPSSQFSPRTTSNAERKVDTRSLLGLTKKAARTPEPTVPVKKQILSPDLSKISTSATGLSPPTGTIRGVRVPTTSQAVVASGFKSVTTALRYRGNTIESAIDLTSDNEDDDIQLKPMKSNSLRSLEQLSKWKGKGRAHSPSHQLPLLDSPTPRSGTDELLLKSSEGEPSPPPGSSSPPIISPVTPAPDSLEKSAIASQSSTDKARHSAPVLLESETRSNPPSLQPTGIPTSDDTPKASVTARSYSKPVSSESKSGPSIQPVLSHTPNAQVPDVIPSTATSEATSISQPTIAPSNEPSVKPSPATLHTPPASSKTRASPPIPLVLTTSNGSSHTHVSTKDMPKIDDELPDISSDVEMKDPQTSEDDSTHETEVRRALMADDPFYDSSDPETEELFAMEEAQSSHEAGSNGTLSLTRAIRRMSRRSSHSSGPATSDITERDSGPVSRNTTPDESTPLGPSVNKTLGGFPAITWKEYRQNLDNFIPKCLRSADLPHSLQDQVNHMSEYMQKMAALRDVFQAMILENTIENEPEAPPILVINDIDDEPTPPWEFHYTNEMWHGNNVPPPDMKSLISCSCKGACSPKSKSCACLKRQRQISGEPNISEFAYDRLGRLRTPGYPIFECNDLCGCGDECRNRVVQHGRTVQVVIKKTKHKGWGIFAGPKKIPSGTFIGIYAGELLTDEEAHTRGTFYNKSGKTYLFDLDFWHLKNGQDEVNGNDWTNKYTVDAYQAGNFTRFFNHSCSPNCSLQPCYINEGNMDKPLLVFFSHKDIEPHEEICFDYSGGDDDENEEATEETVQVQNDDKIYAKCMCGAPNCKGTMFKQ